MKRGNKHTYLGMDFEIKNQKVVMTMADFLNECIDSFGEVIDSNAATPATKSLMSVNTNSLPLNNEKQAIFHHIVAKILYICKWARLDLQVAIGFLCSRVSAPLQQDW